MARPIDRERRRKLVGRAVEILREEGFDLSMAKLAERLELKRPTLLYYFPTKAEIVESALEALLAEQAVHVIGKMMEHEHPIDQLYAQLRAVHEFHHGKEARLVFLTQAIAATGLETSNRIVEIGNQAFEAQRDVMRERLKQSIAEGCMHDCDIESLIRVVRSAIDGLMVQRFMTGCDLEPIHEFFWTHLLGPLKRDPEES